jgi:ubiquitin carboxyl-terminal hydrolase L3
MNPLAHHLGLSPTLSFHDVLSFNDSDLLAFIPRPVHALLFLFYTTPHSQAHFAVENAATPQYASSGPDEPVLWYNQTITHACGLIGLLHCVTNGVPKNAIMEGSILSKFIKEATPLDPEARAQLIYDSAELEAAHFEAAKQGDSVAPDVHNGEDVEGAFVAFVKSGDGRMWELEGRRKGPVVRGLLAENEDLLCEKAIELGPMAYMRREVEAGGKHLRFSCLALAESFE